LRCSGDENELTGPTIMLLPPPAVAFSAPFVAISFSRQSNKTGLQNGLAQTARP